MSSPVAFSQLSPRSLVGEEEAISPQDIIDKVNSVGQKTIRVVAGILIAGTAAFIASYGIIATFVVLVARIMVIEELDKHAQTSIIDPASPLSTAEKVELFVRAQLWKMTILAATSLGAGIELIYQGFSNLSFSLGVVSFLKETFSVVIGSLLGAPGFGFYEHSYLNRAYVDHFINVCNMLKEKEAPKEIAQFILDVEQPYNHPILKKTDTEEQIKEKICDFMIIHPQTSFLSLANYLSEVDNLRTDPIYTDPIITILDKQNNITGTDILTNLSSSMFITYTSCPDLQERMPQMLLESNARVPITQDTENKLTAFLGTRDSQLPITVTLTQAERDELSRAIDELRSTADLIARRVSRFPADGVLSNTDDLTHTPYNLNCNTLKIARANLEKLQSDLLDNNETIIAKFFSDGVLSTSLN